MLTKKMLEDMPKDTIFATGVTIDSPDGINMMNTRRQLRWIAVRGGIYDWAIYIHYDEHTIGWLRNHGDKVYSSEHIKKLVESDKEAFALYRF